MSDQAELFRASSVKYFIVDAFTNRPFSGNPAAVVLLDAWKEDSWLQQVAAEMNLSETAFLVPSRSGYELRWLTPQSEVDLCGHATLASARVLAELDLLADEDSVSFSTRSGELIAQRLGNQIRLDFPALSVEPCKAPAGLLDALATETMFVGRSRFDSFVEVESESVVRELSPDFRGLASVDCRGIVVTARSEDSRFDFVSRFFAPAVGIDEDPVTGSAHCSLTPYWAQKLGKTQLVAFQASRRGGVLQVELRDSRVLLQGEAMVVARGEIIASSTTCP